MYIYSNCWLYHLNGWASVDQPQDSKIVKGLEFGNSIYSLYCEGGFSGRRGRGSTMYKKINIQSAPNKLW